MGHPTPNARPCRSPADPAWTTLRERLWQTALALTRSREDADDLTQQTFAALLARQPERIDHMGYARQTMFRLWLDQQRSMRRRVGRMAKLAINASGWQTDRDRPADTERNERMQRAIEALPPRQRAIIVLRLIEELDYGAIATTLGCSVETIRANLHLARKNVRRMIGEPL